VPRITPYPSSLIEPPPGKPSNLSKRIEFWSSSQGHFMIRALTTHILVMNVSNLRVHAGQSAGNE
jgi:CO/xanthine dehydrogenase Mo-binding subunit